MITNQGSIDVLRTILFHASLDAQIRLCQNDVGVLDPEITLADLVECDFDGYAPVPASTLPTPALNGSDEAETDSPELVWTAGAGVTTQIAYGVYVTFLDETATLCLLTFDRFQYAQLVENPGDVMKASVFFFAWNGVP